MTIGERLKEERERLGFTQPAFAGLAETTKKSQIDYEKDLTQPKAGYLAAIAKVGANIQYIVTGEREAQLSVSLAPDEQLLLDRYRSSSQALKDASIRVLLGGSEGKPSRTVSQVIHGEVGQVNKGSTNTGSITIHMGGDRKPKGE